MKIWIAEKAGREIPLLIFEDISPNAFPELNIKREIEISFEAENLVVLGDYKDRATVKGILTAESVAAY